MLPPASKAVLPVIAAHINGSGEAWPSEQTIGILAGLSGKQVRAGVKGLDGFPGYSWKRYSTQRGRRSKKFKMDIPKPKRGEAFPFFRFVIESGAWSEAKPASKALYPVMRYFAYYDRDDCGAEDCPEDDYIQEFAEREFEICAAEIPLMADLAGISRQSVYNAIKNLEVCRLVKSIAADVPQWLVYLRAKDGLIINTGYLNQKVQRAYSHISL